MASSRTPVSERAAAWRAMLAPWLESLHDRLSLVVPTLPDRHTIARHLWVRFAVPDQTESTLLQAAGYAERAWLEALEALELLDLLARVDSAACWTILVDLCDAAETLRRHACPVEFFYGVQPRYELRFAQAFAPTDRVETLLCGGPRRASSTVFTQTKRLLIAALRSARHDDANNQVKPLRLSPVRLRYWFVLPGSTQERSTAIMQYNATVRFLKRVLALAKDLLVAWKPRNSSRFFVCAFGFYLPPVNARDGVRTLLRQITSHMPIFSLTYQRADPYDRNFFGPFLWTLLPSHDSPKSTPYALLGLRKLAVSSHAVQGDEIAALCASIGQSRSLREFTSLDDSSYPWRYNPTWVACLAFTLFHKSATHEIHTVQLNLGDLGIEAMTRMLTKANPATYLAAIFDGSTTEGTYSRPPLTTVRVRAQAHAVHRKKAKAFEVKTLSQGTEDVECYVAGQDYGELIRVLAPGVGLCCVHRRDVVSEHPVEDKGSHPVRSLTLRVTGAFAAIARLLALMGEPLTELVLMNVGASQDEAVSLDELLRVCPRLKRLELSRVTLSQQSLVPNGGWGHELESLTLRSCDIIPHKRQRNEKLCVVTATTFPRLASLAIEVRGTTMHAPSFAEFLVDLAVARDVQRFVVISDDEAIKHTYRSLLARQGRGHGDHMCALPLRHKLALLSAVSAGGTGPSLAHYQLNADTIALIFAMVAPAIRQRICTFVD